MTTNTRSIDEHMGALMSGYVDGELTQQERQHVDVHCDACSQCAEELGALKKLRQRVGNATLSEYGEDKWRETMDDTTVRGSRGIGWLMLIGGLLAICGIGIFAFLTDPQIELPMKIIIGALYGGGAMLFISVLRQRLIERKTDKYKNVEI